MFYDYNILFLYDVKLDPCRIEAILQFYYWAIMLCEDALR